MASDFQQINDYNFNIDSFVQGNNGAVLRFNVRRKGAIVPIDNATVNVAIKRGQELITKNATIISAPSGICEVTLTRADLATAGTYYLQPTIIFPDDDEFSGDVQKFTVSGKLSGAPTNPGNGGTNPVFTVRDSAINGNIVINGAETVVYDDTNKVDKVAGKGLSTNDYDNTEKAEVAKVKNKADTSYVDSQLGLKADKTYVDTQLSGKATNADLGDLSSLNTTDRSSVVNALKEIKTQANTNATSITAKADKSYVDTQLADKAKQADVFPLINAGLSGASGFDNTTILNNFLASGVQGVVKLPRISGWNSYGISNTINIPSGVRLDLDGMTLTANPSFPTSNPIISISNSTGRLQNGTIEGNLLANTGIVVKSGSNSRLTNVRISGCTNKAIDVQSGAAACHMTNISGFVPPTFNAPSGSVGLDMNAPDSHVEDVVMSGYSIGVRNLGPNNKFVNIHPWNTITNDFNECAMTVGFWCGGQGSVYVNCYADSPRTANGATASYPSNNGFGFLVTNTNQTFIGCVTMVPYWSYSVLVDNTTIGFYDNVGYNSFIGCTSWALSPLCRIYKDFDGAGVANSTLLGNITTNVSNIAGDGLKNGLTQLSIYKKQANNTTSVPVTNDDQTGAAEVKVQTAFGGGFGGLKRYGSSHATTAYQKATVLTSIDSNLLAFYTDSTNSPIQFDVGSVGARQFKVWPDHVSSYVPVNFPAYTTALRPVTGIAVGSTIFDTTLNKLITYNGTVWKDGTGATV